MDRFPKMVYRFPAQLADRVRLQDDFYDTHVVADEAAHDEARTAGWYETPADAREAAAAVKELAEEALAVAGAKAADTSDDNVPVTRAELEQKATELEIKFDGRTTDAKLAARIGEALAK